jgi:hypothetical protein
MGSEYKLSTQAVPLNDHTMAEAQTAKSGHSSRQKGLENLMARH